MNLSKKSAIIILAALPLFSYAASALKEKTIQDYLGSLLPEKLSKFEPGKTTESEIIKSLGKAPESDKNILYYEISGIKYDLSIQTENGVLQSMTYDLPASDTAPKSNFGQFKKWIDEKKLGEIQKSIDSQKGHDRGRFFEVSFPEQGISLKFKNIDSKELKQIQFTAKNTGVKK